MTPFFRKIRKKLADDNRPVKYARYAIGEILLVVIGILIALQINNWNQSKYETKEMTNYLQKIHIEIEKSIERIQRRKVEVDTLIIHNERSLYLLNLKNKDSLVELKETLGALGTASNSSLNFPIFEEFINQGFLAKLKNDSLKLKMQYLSMGLELSDRVDTYINNQYHTSIEPYFYKNINYSEVVDERLNLLVGGPETNYEQFFNNLELWNLVTFKHESFITHRNVLINILKSLESLDNTIVKQLNIN